MNFNATPTRRTRLAALAASIALAGCGDSTPTEQAGIKLPPNNGFLNDNVQHFPEGPEFPYASTQAATQRARMAAQGVPVGENGTAEQTMPIAAPEPAALRDRVALERSADSIRDGVQQTAAEAARGADDLKGGVTRAVGEAQAQAGQAASDAAAGAKGFAAEARDEAAQAVTGAVDEVKAGVAGTVDEAKAGVTGAVDEVKANVRGAADSARDQVRTAARNTKDKARNQVKSAVDGAKDAARRQAEAAGAEVRKSASDLKDQVLGGLLGPAPKKD